MVFVPVAVFKTVLALIAAAVAVEGGQSTSPHAVPLEAPCATENLAAMAGQTIMVGFPGKDETDDGVRAARAQLRAGEIGGVVLFPENISDHDQLKSLIASLRAAVPGLPPFIAVDQEGGAVLRLKPWQGFKSFPSAAEVGQSTFPEAEAEAIYTEMAQELAEVGFNMNLGPVVDLDTNPSNPVIGGRGRSFGAEADVVTPLAATFVKAHHAANIATVAKHYPGHGSSIADSHRALADVSLTWVAQELEPYRRLIAQGLLDAVMIGHLYHPRFSDLEGLPATLSGKAVHSLRSSRGLGFDGVVMSDDMEMGAVRDLYTQEDLAVRAIRSGTDIVVFSNVENSDPDLGARLHRAIVEAVCDGRLSRNRIEGAYRRIATLKKKLKSNALASAPATPGP